MARYRVYSPTTGREYDTDELDDAIAAMDDCGFDAWVWENGRPMKLDTFEAAQTMLEEIRRA